MELINANFLDYLLRNKVVFVVGFGCLASPFSVAFQLRLRAFAVLRAQNSVVRHIHHVSYGDKNKF